MDTLPVENQYLDDSDPNKFVAKMGAEAVEGLLKSLDVPDAAMDEIWADEAERRLAAYREGKLKGIPMEEIFNPLK